MNNTILADSTYTVFLLVVEYAFRFVGTGFINGSRECNLDFHVHSLHIPSFQVDVSEDGKQLFLGVRLPHGLISMDRAIWSIGGICHENHLNLEWQKLLT